MKKDPDLDPLRRREDFKKLAAELEGKGKYASKPNPGGRRPNRHCSCRPRHLVPAEAYLR